MLTRNAFLFIIPLSLSAFTHMWNPVGFPDIFYDEGVYMRRAMHVLQGLGPQESTTYYDHPFFGQLFLAGVFYIIGYPDSLHPSSDVQSIQMLYLVPRILMGILAVIDTFLIYKISERKYNRNVAFVASILFAVMPMTWLTRRIFLDNIVIPLLLSSIWFAISLRNQANVPDKSKTAYNRNKILLILLSGIFLGLAVFTKIPAMATTPLVGFVIFNSNRSWKILGLWFVPIVLIALIWPVYSLAAGQYDAWLHGIAGQAQRNVQIFSKSMEVIFNIDPILIILFFIGLSIAILRRDVFILLWAIPNLLFLYFIGYSPIRIFIPLLPLFCIASAAMIVYLVEKIKSKNIQKISLSILVTFLGIFGLVSTTMLITTSVTTSQFETISFVSSYLGNYTMDSSITVASSPVYSWILKDAFGFDEVLPDYRSLIYYSIITDKILLIDDDHFNQDKRAIEALRPYYNNTYTIASFKVSNNFDRNKYPYQSMNQNNEGLVEIKVRIGNNSQVHKTFQ